MENAQLVKNYNRILKRVDSAIKKYRWGNQKVAQAAAYSIEAGGKRLRPVLLLEMATQTQGPKKALNPLPAAIALESIHTFSLIHDDLPCIDNATLRRGKKACHKAFGEHTALLAGDLLLNEAYRILSKSYPADIAAPLIEILSDTTRRIIDGEFADIEAERLPMAKVDLDFIYKHKTAAMFSAPIRMGLTLAGWDKKAIAPLGRAAEKLGVSFQLIDDLLDIESSTKKLGKNTQQDKRKKTFLKKNGKTWCRTQAQKLSASAIRAFQKDLPKPDFTVALIEWMRQRDY